MLLRASGLRAFCGMTTRARPLSGIRVLDMSRLLPGPYASLVLADLGAEVDKLEEPGVGDYLRAMPPQRAAEDGGGDAQSSIFLLLNRDKRSLVVDLKKPEARDVVLRMLPRYDVVLEQFRPGVLDRLGLGPAAMRAANPKLVVCSLTGFGQDGPLAQRAGHDIGYVARAGALYAPGPKGGPPTVPGVQTADIGGALWTVIGVLAALAARDRSGEGSHVDVSMLEASLGFAAVPFGLLGGGVSPPPGGDALTGGLVGYGTYATKDGRAVALGALEPKFLSAFFAEVGLSLDASLFVPGPHQADTHEKLAAIFRERTQAEWIAVAARGDYCLEPVLTPAEATNDAQLRARGAFFELASPWGELLAMRSPVTPRDAAHRPPPRVGEHTRAILSEAGFGADELDGLAARGVIPRA